MEYKHLRVKSETHTKVKAFAAIEGVSVDKMVKILIQSYRNNNISKAREKQWN